MFNEFISLSTDGKEWRISLNLCTKGLSETPSASNRSGIYKLEEKSHGSLQWCTVNGQGPNQMGRYD
jgi:hypothetical protein